MAAFIAAAARRGVARTQAGAPCQHWAAGDSPGSLCTSHAGRHRGRWETPTRNKHRPPGRARRHRPVGRCGARPYPHRPRSAVAYPATGSQGVAAADT
jgi:hypothetical protein